MTTRAAVVGLSFELACAAVAYAQPAASRVIHVVDSATGRPVPAARVAVGTHGITTKADADGRVALDQATDTSLARPGCVVHVSAAGYGDEALECSQLVGPPITVLLIPDGVQLSERVVVTARLDRADVSPFPRATTVIDAAEVERRQSRTTPEALDEAPGVWVQKTSHGGGSPVIRGLVGNQILVLVDGIRLNNATFRYGPNQYLATVDVFGLDRLEVIRGAGSVLFGSDAMGGVINVLTRPPELSASGHQATGAAMARAVTGGMEQSARGEASYSGGRLGVRGGVTVRRFGDLRAGGALGVEAPSAYDEVAGDARFLLQLSPSSTLNAGWQHVHQDDVPRFDQVRQRGFERWSFAPQARQLAWARVNQRLRTTWLHTASVTASWQRSSERRERQARGASVFIAEDDVVDSVGVMAEAQAAPAGGLAVRFGADVYDDRVRSGRQDTDVTSGIMQATRGLYPNGATSRSIEAFAHATWQRGRLALDGGLRRTWASTSALDPGFGALEIDPSATIGSVNAGWTLGEGLSAYGVVSQAFRAPNIDDTSTLGAFDFGVEVPAADLVPERSLSLESGVRLRRPRLAVAAAVWRTSLSDLVDRVRGTYLGLDVWEGQRVYRRANVGDATLRGFEVEGRASLGGQFEVGGFLAYAYGQQQVNGQPMRRVPPLNGHLSLGWRHRRAHAEAGWRAAAEQDRLAPGDRDDHRIAPGGTPQWHVVDLRGSYAFTPTLHAVARAGNVFDRAYRVHGSGIDGMGRHLSLSLRVGSR
jgi:hemoglobin/transferrin/lactoferrin receptor protein